MLSWIVAFIAFWTFEFAFACFMGGLLKQAREAQCRS